MFSWATQIGLALSYIANGEACNTSHHLLTAKYKDSANLKQARAVSSRKISIPRWTPPFRRNILAVSQPRAGSQATTAKKE